MNKEHDRLIGKMSELEQFIQEKSFALHPYPGATMVVKVDDLLDWMMARTDKVYLSAIVGL
jgi:hypothetical protein